MAAATTSLYASVAPQFTRALLRPGLCVGYSDAGGRIDQLLLHFVEVTAVEKVDSDRFLTCVYLVTCEDLDKYKSIVRPAVAAWVAAMTAAHMEWLVVYVPLGTRPKAAGTNAPNAVYKKIYDRLRADCVHKRNSGAAASSASSGSLLQERVCKIDALEGTSVVGQRQQQHESQWTEVLLRLRRCVMHAFQTKCFQYEERLRMLDTKRGLAGWDFGAFFVAKERLALMYQQMCLQDDAIRHLDELDAIFINSSATEKRAFQSANSTVFERHDPIFTQSPLTLDLYEVQQLIASNRASARHILLYCFCRQIRTLYVMGSYCQLLERASSFIELFLSELKELASEGILDWHQPFLWALGACMEVSRACELSWSGRDDERAAFSVLEQTTQANSTAAMSRALGSVFYLARRILKSAAKFIRNRNNSHMSRPNTTNADPADVSVTWYHQLEQAFVSPEWQRSGTCGFYEHCLSEITRLASMHFSQSGRHRFAVFLDAECAQYHIARGEYKSALRLLRALMQRSKQDGWWSIYGACVQSVYRAELSLGRFSQAMAACLTLLQLAQKGQDNGSNERMAQLMVAHLARHDSRKAASEVVVSAGDIGSLRSDPAMGMDELFKCTLAVETALTGGSVLEHGDICAALAIASAFPGNVLFDKVCVRFAKTICPRKTLATKASSDCEYPGLNESIDVDACVVSIAEKASGDTLAHEINCRHSNRTVMVESATTCDDATENVHGQDTELILEKNDVHVDDKTGVSLVFRHADVPVGQYTCTGVECVLAGNTFCLLSPSALPLVDFEICAEGSAIEVAIDGAPLLVPRPFAEVETVAVSIEANNDTATNGVLDPLTETVRLKRVGMRIFASITLVCNPFISIVLQGYRLRCPGQAGNHPSIRVEQDLNAKLRGSTLQPDDRLHLAFTLACSTDFEKAVSDSYCALQLDITFGGNETWLKTLTVRVPLTAVIGRCYRIDIRPEGQDDVQMYTGKIVETSASKPVTFQVRVQEETKKSNEATTANDDRTTLSLRLDESSEHDWILLGKQLERFHFDRCSQSHDEDWRKFETQKRFLATRSGLLRFPAFLLEVDGNPVPAARVYCQQSCRQVLASE
ncbi:unnamed protein product [Hyaloperonospora brassicae]|uniref:Trafficking protein particle complex subunit 11 domain-containing protein n=1 Tax=Hyaloperonospora brassicae TaxID=162125 RepID=A0AAV0U941_HYABA|nr:unnamed protein product [Hyaloperonospora brassicae]